VGAEVFSETFPERCVMKPTFTAACAALVGLLALSQSAVAQQKTAKQCNDEWSADRAAIQASGKTKRVFVAECRGVPVATRVAAALPAGKDQYATEAEAKSNCRADTVVWVNSTSRVYHGSGSRSYGKTKTGAYMCEKESVAAGFRAAKTARAAAT
jgi:hypothetical protein